LCLGIIDFKKGNQPRTNIVTDEKGDLVTDCHSILARWRNHVSQLLTVHGVNDVGQTEVHAAEPLVPEPSAFEVEMAIENLKRCRSPGVDQIPAELMKAGISTVCSEVHKLNSVWNKQELPAEWKEPIIVPIYKKSDKTVCSKCRGMSFVICVQNNIQHPAVKVNSICGGNFWGSSVWITTQRVNY